MSGILLQNKANNNILVGIKILSGRGSHTHEFSAITFADGASSSAFGNILTNINASDSSGYFKYLIEDLSRFSLFQWS